MITLLVSGGKLGEEPRTTLLITQDLEVGFELLTVFIREGVQLNAVHLLEGERLVKLPIEAFDTVSMRQGITNLQTDWESLLGIPPAKS